MKNSTALKIQVIAVYASIFFFVPAILAVAVGENVNLGRHLLLAIAYTAGLAIGTFWVSTVGNELDNDR